jgi:hypothetical protein
MPSSDVKYIGLDVHKEAIAIAVLNGAGKLVMESIVETKVSSGRSSLRSSTGGYHHPVFCTLIPTPTFTPPILHKSRMRRRARTDLPGGRSVMSVPTGSLTNFGAKPGREGSATMRREPDPACVVTAYIDQRIA